jgi:hypothetical protein
MALFKSVEQNNWFKKYIQGGTQKNLLCNRGILKDFFAGDKTKFAYFAEVKTYLPEPLTICLRGPKSMNWWMHNAERHTHQSLAQNTLRIEK